MNAVGIDGGGTRTRAAVVDEEGHLVAYGEGASVNVDDHGAERAAANLRDLLSPLRQRAGVPRFDAAFLGLGGVLTDADRAEVRRVALATDLAPEAAIGVHHDAYAALEGGLLGAPGLIVVAGTGSICFGRAADGREARCGNWGPLLGDEASGHWLGREALRAVARTRDGRAPATALTDPVLAWLDLDEVDGLLRRVHVDGLARAEIAAFAPTFLRIAAEGDDVADAILARGCDELAECVAVVGGATFPAGEVVPAIVTGGLGADTTWRAAFDAAVARRAPNVGWREARLPPVLGAARAALGLAGVPVDAAGDAQLQVAAGRLT